MKFTTLAFSLSTVAIATAGIDIADNKNIKNDVVAIPSDNIKNGESNNAAGTVAPNNDMIDETRISGDKPTESYLGAAGNFSALAGSALGAAGAPAEDSIIKGDSIDVMILGDVAPAEESIIKGDAIDAMILGDSASMNANKEEITTGAEEVALVVKDASGANFEGTLELQKMEGGASVIYVKKDGDARKFDLKDGVASVKAEGKVSVVGQVEAPGGAAVLAAGKLEAHAVAEQKLEFNAQGKVTNVQFYVSAQLTVGISLNGLIPEDCKPIEIYKQVSPKAKAPAFAGNSSMSTVTDWVTYCPEATTITMTTCVQEMCKPTAITVTGETTVTITGECLVEATAAVAAKASGGVAGTANGNAGAKGGDSNPVKEGDAGKAAPDSKTPAPMSAAPKASAPAAAGGSTTNQTALVSTNFNGAAKNAAGFVGAVGVLAFLM